MRIANVSQLADLEEEILLSLRELSLTESFVGMYRNNFQS